MTNSTLIVTGMSGAGKTQAMKALEDLGLFCIDNLPPPLLRDLSGLPGLTSAKDHPVAVAMDVRGRAMFDHLLSALDTLKDDGKPHQILFLECNDDILVRRYSETRRKHPLSEDCSLFEGIAAERRLLAPIRDRADIILDTSRMKSGELKLRLGRMVLGHDVRLDIAVEVTSFGFKHGVPLDADLMFDVRFLTNPYYDPELRVLGGLDAPVAEFVLGLPEAQRFIDDVCPLLEHWVPLHAAAGKARLVIAIGCTGGQHRSVAISEQLATRLAEKFRNVDVIHRDMRKNIAQIKERMAST
ncbi:RNase adapter RapZ [Oceanibium sediminis]|uniref:RNase adapter RapZ n=1 Tax=Oceanibium sediminis TaxID=2026339 RepID=UPI000DD4B5A5|nr:RNase adapter RapZ [Oceanibium sediminis]